MGVGKRFSRTLALLAACVLAAGAGSGAASAAAGITTSATPSGSIVSSANVGALQTYIQRYPDQFSGVYIDTTTHTVTVDAAAASSTTANALLGRELSALPRTAATSASTGLDLSVRMVRYSQSQLDTVMSQITSQAPWAALARPVLARWGVDPISDTVVVGVTQLSPQLAAVARSVFGGEVTLETQQRPDFATNTTKLPPDYRVVDVSSGKASTSSAVSPNVAPDPSRLLDTTPYFGGDRIYRLVAVTGGTELIQCTVAFKWAVPSMSGAGHCGPTGTIWAQGYYEPSNNTLYKTGTMGTVYSTQWGNQRIDGELMSGGSWDPFVYIQLQSAVAVGGSGAPTIGATTCTDGSYTNQNCTALISQINQCVTVNDNGTPVDVCGLDIATSTNGTLLCQPGDSGGPVYRHSGSYVFADGIISACSGDLSPGGKTVYFTDITRMISTFGSAIATS